MKKLLTILFLLNISMLSYSQVSFSKFKFKKDSPFGCCPGRKMTDVKFKITSDKAIKYVRVYYYGVNQVGDAVSSDIVGAVNADVEHTKHRMIFFTGPFETNKTYSRWASGTFIYPLEVIAFPYLLEILYMNGEEEKIKLNKENFHIYFPCIKKWIDVNVEDGI